MAKVFGIEVRKFTSEKNISISFFIVGAPSPAAAVYNLGREVARKLNPTQGRAAEGRLWTTYKRGGLRVKELTEGAKAREVKLVRRILLSPDGEVLKREDFSVPVIKVATEVVEAPVVDEEQKKEVSVIEEAPTKKVRKPRKDKGIARGPRKKTEVVAVEETDDDSPF